MSTSVSAEIKAPHSVDIHVGAKVRIRRRFLGLSQTELATAVGVTFQQVQKYERGLNRISASKLYEIAHVLKTPLTYFFDGHGTDELTGKPQPIPANFLATPEGMALAEAFPRIRGDRQRRQILELIRSLADE